MSALEAFHPAVSRWFARAFAAPTEPQRLAWPAIAAGEHTLIAAPTGSGKTLAAFLAALDALVRSGLEHPDGALPDATRVVYVSPLKALSNDVHRNLELPLAGIAAELERMGLPAVGIRTLVRTGDTPAAERARMVKRPPHVLVTTPESLYILLGSDGGRAMLATAETAIVDEIHAVVGDKRGAHLALSLERLDELVGRGGGRLQRVGLSATQKPIDEVARFLTGAGRETPGEPPAPPTCALVDVGHARDLDLGIEVPLSPLGAVMSNEVWEEIYDRLAERIAGHRTTLVFVNTRRMAERVTRHLAERLGEEAVTSHHGSLSKDQRLAAEQRLKGGELRALVATSSLELGIDVGAIELVCQLGSTRTIATLLQRVGRSEHTVAGRPRGRIFPLSRDELVEAAALVEAVRAGELDRLEIPPEPLDVLAQQIVAAVAAEEWDEDALYRLVRRAHNYRDLPRDTFDEVVAMLAHGFTTRRGRRGAYLHHDAVNRRLRPRRGARLVALTSGGAIPDTADYDVVLEPQGVKIGTLDEDFAVESMAGDVFQLGNASWRVLRIEQGRVRVEDAHGEPPSIPFWFGEAPGRSDELSAAVSRLREGVAERLAAAADRSGGLAAARGWLEQSLGLDPEAARQLVDYLAAGAAALGAMPTTGRVVAERFFDGAGDMHLVLHAPFGSRVNRAWGLALRKRFCRKFNFELQAAATEDAILLSLGPSHSFPLAEVFDFLSPATVRDLLVQALLDAPMFGVRWRWNATRSLALPRFRGGRRVPAPLLRQSAEDLVAVVFPDQLACLETISGDREVPDHPLVRETLRDCLTEAMDVDRLEAILGALDRGAVETLARDLTEPSPFSLDILNARPYSYLDDAPLEERRTQAVLARRWLDPETADDLGRLDPEAIERVRDEARPAADSPDELHDALVVHGYLPAAEGEAAGHGPLLEALAAARRATVLTAPSRPDPPDGGAPVRLWVAAERLPELAALHPEAVLEPPIAAPPRFAERAWSAAEAAVELVRGRLEALGPVTAAALAAEAGVARGTVETALGALEAEGFALRGRFTPRPLDGAGKPNGSGGEGGEEWCERRLLARIHRYTVGRLRREIQPVGVADFSRFLLDWQRVAPGERGEGPESLAAVLDQLEGFEAAAAAWEGDLLPARLDGYDPAWLDQLCLSGRYVWCRLTPPAGNGKPAEPEKDGDHVARTGGKNGKEAGWGEGRAAVAGEGARDGAVGAAVASRRGKEAGWDEATAAGSAVAARRAGGDSPMATAAVSPPGRGRRRPRGGGDDGRDRPGRRRTRPAPIRSTPLALVRRERLPLLRALAAGEAVAPPALSAEAEAVRDYLEASGASFFADLVRGTGLLGTQVETALAELAALGRVTSDGFTGLRALLVPAAKKPSASRRRRTAVPDMASAGRWSLLPPGGLDDPSSPGSGQPLVSSRATDEAYREAVESFAWALLHRYGVVFRKLLDREGAAPPWRDLLRAFRRLEARGEIRGGRFVDGFSGEQYAHPEAVAKLRAVRRRPPGEALVSVSAADPLNLVGILTPGARLAALAPNRLLYRGGLPAALRESGEVRFLDRPLPGAPAEPGGTGTAEAHWEAEKALLRRPVPPELRAYLG